MNNQGQPGQPNPMAGQAVPGAQRQPPMYRPEMMRNLPILNDEEKAKYERGLRQLWNHYETHPEDSTQHQESKKKIQDFTKMLVNKLQQRRMQVQQAQQQAAQQQAGHQGQPQAAGHQGQSQQQQSQPSQPSAPPQQTQPQPPAATTSQTNTAGPTVKTEVKTEIKTESTPISAEPAPTPTAAPAPTPAPASGAPTAAAPQQFPEHILHHIRQMTFNAPPSVVDKGPEAAARWASDCKSKYLRALMQMDSNGNQIKRIDAAIRDRQEKGNPYTAEEQKQLQIRRDHAQKMYAEAAKFVEGFRKNQDTINKGRGAQAGAAQPGARPPQQQPQQQSQQQQQQQAQQQAASQQQQAKPQQNSPAVAAAQTPATQAGAQASPVPAAAGTPAMQNTQTSTAVNAAIEAAKNQQMAAAAARGTPQQQQAQQAQAHALAQQQQAHAQHQQQAQHQTQPPQPQAPTPAQAPTPSAPTPTTSQPAQPQQAVAPAPPQQQQAMSQGQQQQQQHPPPVNTAIASVSAAGGLPSAGTPTQNRVATPQSAIPVGPGQALSHSAAVSRANQRVNSQTSAMPVQQPTPTPGSAGAQGVMGSGAAHGHAHPTQPAQTLQSKLPIPKQLPEKATAVPQPVVMTGGAGLGRPTYTGGGGIAGGVMGQPAMAKIPAYVHEAEGDHVLSKKKLDELVRQVCGGNPEGQDANMLTPEVEESVLTMADSFVDNVLETAARNAKERGSKVLEIRDIQLVLERTYNIRVPGYSSDELRTVRKIQPSAAWITKMSAIQAAKVTSGKGE